MKCAICDDDASIITLCKECEQEDRISVQGIDFDFDDCNVYD